MHKMILSILLVTFSISCTPKSPNVVRTEKAEKKDKWETAISGFEKMDQQNPPPRDAVLFIGSSSIRMWKDLATDFPDTKVINRGFGGSCIADSTRYVDRIVAPYHPRKVILYAGDNDVASGHTAQQVFEDYKEFVKQVRSKLPGVPIGFISIKPSPSRIARMEVMREANELIRKYVEQNKDLMYIDVFNPMLGQDGKPRPELFLKDNLHMNRQGYDLWKQIVASYLK